MTTEVLPVGVDDPTNAAILAVSEDRIAGFRRDPLGEIAERSGVRPRDGDRARARDARGRNDPPRTADAAREQTRTGSPRRVAGARGSPARRVRLHAPAGPIHGPLRDPHDRRRDAGLQLPAMDDAEGADRVLARAALRVPRRGDRRRALPPDACQEAVHARRRPRAPPRPGARQPHGRARRRDQCRGRAARRGRLARADGAQARVRAARGRRRPVGSTCHRGRHGPRCVLCGGRGPRPPRRRRSLLDVPRAREASRWRTARDALQRALSLGGASGPRARRWPRGRPPPRDDARLLA